MQTVDTTLFIILTSITLSIIALGFWKKEGAYSFIGFFFIFLIGTGILISGNLEYKAGYSETTNYNYNSTDTLLNTTTIRTDTYSSYSTSLTRSWGVYLALLGAIGMAITTTEIKKAFG